MPDRSRKRPTDPNELAKRIVDLATGEAVDPENAPEVQPDESKNAPPEKDAAAVALGRRGGLKGGKARANALSPAQRAEISRKAALSRWKRDS